MKRIIMLLFILTLTLSVSACSNNTTGTNSKNLNGSLESILTEIYASEKLGSDFKNNTVPGLVTTPITTDRVEYYLGKSGLEFKEAIASESSFSTSAYSLVLVRAKEGQDITKLKNDIKTNVNPQKWVCVGVDPSNVIVENIGDVVILIMSNYETQNLRNAFLDLNK